MQGPAVGETSEWAGAGWLAVLPRRPHHGGGGAGGPAEAEAGGAAGEARGERGRRPSGLFPCGAPPLPGVEGAAPAAALGPSAGARAAGREPRGCPRGRAGPVPASRGFSAAAGTCPPGLFPVRPARGLSGRAGPASQASPGGAGLERNVWLLGSLCPQLGVLACFDRWFERNCLLEFRPT